jgi:hypothetical protein
MKSLFQIILMLGISTAASASDLKAEFPKEYFSSQSIQLVDVRNYEFDSFGFVSKKTYYFESCLMLNLEFLPPGLRFKVNSGADELKVITDINGCIEWSETFSLSFLAPEYYIKFTRTIVSDNGLVNGELKLQYYINPHQNLLIDQRYMTLMNRENELK